MPFGYAEEVPLAAQVQRMRQRQEQMLLAQTHQGTAEPDKQHRRSSVTSPALNLEERKHLRPSSARPARKSAVPVRAPRPSTASMSSREERRHPPAMRANAAPGKRRRGKTSPASRLPSVTSQPHSGRGSTRALVSEGEQRKRDFVAALWAKSSQDNASRLHRGSPASPSPRSPFCRVEECESLFSEAEDPTKEMIRNLPLDVFRDSQGRDSTRRAAEYHSSGHDHTGRGGSGERERLVNSGSQSGRSSSTHADRDIMGQWRRDGSRPRPFSAAQRTPGPQERALGARDHFAAQVEEIEAIIANRNARSTLQRMLHTPTGSLSVELAKRKELDCIEQELTEKAALLETRKRELEAELEQIKKARKAILREAARQHISIGRLFKMRLRDFYRMVRTNELQYSRVAYREAAAITIQTAWRASLASDFVNVLRKAKGMQPRIRFAQFQVTGKASVQQLQDMLEALSDAQMEGVPTAVRRELKIALEKHLTEKAAVSVQKAFRGHRARHVTVPQTKNYRDEWQEFWSDDGKDDGADVRSRASSSVNKLGQPSLLTTDSVAASSTSRARTSHSYEAYNDSHYGRHEDLDENQKGGAAEFRSVSWQEQQQQNDDEARRGSAAFSGAYQEATAGLESVDNAQFKEWPDAPVEQDEALPTQEGDQSAAEVAYDAPYSPYSAGATEGALSPLETVSGAAAALQESGFVCLTDLDDLSALAPGLQLKMVRSDGTATDVELIGIVSGDNYRVRGRCNDGKIVVKKLKYFFTVPTELLALANEDSFSQETVENVKAQVGTWDICVDEEGNEFYYNRLSGESVWDKPAEVLAAEVEGSLGMSRPRSNPRDSTSSQKPSRGLGKLPKRGGKKKRGKRHQSFDMDELSEVTSPSSPAPATPSYDSNARFDVFF